jgi:hypothetical protein
MQMMVQSELSTRKQSFESRLEASEVGKTGEHPSKKQTAQQGGLRAKSELGKVEDGRTRNRALRTHGVLDEGGRN